MMIENCTMIIFGGAGDLAHRKLIPALYNLHFTGQLPSGFTLIGADRKQRSSLQYREELVASVKKYSDSTWSEEQWNKLAPKIHYHGIDLEDGAAYSRLREFVADLDGGQQNRDSLLYYLALPPQFFGLVAGNLQRQGMNASRSGWCRILIEKPFGHDLASARELDASLAEVFGEQNIYRIDHYLGKEMLQNILVIRFANCIFEPLLNNEYVDNIQITAAESDGIGDRGRYYDRAGAMRDMIQSHLFQMLALTAMESPGNMESENVPENVHREKLKLLKDVQSWPDGTASDKIVFGQYRGFLEENDISTRSQTESFAALKMAVNNDRWQGVPFYLRTGKKLKDKLAKIVIQFKMPHSLYSRILPGSSGPDQENLPNLLTLKVQPKEGVVFQFNINKPGSTGEIVPVDMDFCQPCAYMFNTPEAYERLLLDAMLGDKTRFSSWKEVERAWAIVDSIYEEHNLAGRFLHTYEPGSWGPHAVADMLDREGRRWWD